LETAYELFSRHGIQRIGIDRIVAAAGVAKMTLYRHFASKDDLFTEAFRRAAARELHAVEEATRDDGRPATERIAAAAEAFARRALAEPTRAYALLAEPVDAAVETQRLVFRRGYRDLFARTLAQGVDRGEFDPHDTETVAAALVGALGEALVGPLATPTRNGHEALIATLVSFAEGALPTAHRPLPTLEPA
jgi:AcrR family transcriptional regulator